MRYYKLKYVSENKSSLRQNTSILMAHQSYKPLLIDFKQDQVQKFSNIDKSPL